jgi:hypothetical protein
VRCMDQRTQRIFDVYNFWELSSNSTELTNCRHSTIYVEPLRVTICGCIHMFKFSEVRTRKN